MSVKEMKDTLLQRIRETEDEQFIASMLGYSEAIRGEKSVKAIGLSDDQRVLIQSGKDQVARGEYVSDEDAETDLDHFFEEENKKWGEK